jgi:hypothetical protein
VQVLDPQPEREAGVRAQRVPAAGLAGRQLQRSLGRLRVGARFLDACLGARSGAWLARTLGLGFAVTALSLARPLPDATLALLRMSLVALSWCVGLPALSLAGPTLEQSLVSGRGLLASRGIDLEAMRADRPLLLALWTLRKVAVVALLVLAACAVATSDPWRSARLLGLAGGALVYLTALGAGLGVVAGLCHALGGARGKGLLLGVVLLPELVAPAWPELPTLVGSYAALLDLCLGLGPR